MKIGCIGCGNMGGGLMNGLARAGFGPLFGHDHARRKVEALGYQDSHVQWVETPQELTTVCDLVIVAVKPYQMASMLDQLRPYAGPGKIVVSLAAGFTLKSMKEHIACPCIRVMPNLPVVVGKGVFALCFDDPALTPESRADLLRMFSAVGMATVLPEKQFSAFSSLVGCGPAFIYLFMEGMLNAGISMGFKAGEASKLIAAMVEGSAKLALSEGVSFADLRLRVCSPSGTTICGINHLERTGVAGHAADAVFEAWHRDLKMASESD